MPPTMQDIEKLMERFGALRDALAGTALAQDEDIAAIEKKHAPRIRKLTRQFQEAHAAIITAIGQAPELFEKKRSVVLYGIAAGFRKANGKMTWDDEERVVALIEKHFPDQAEELLKVEKTPVKSALNDLSAAELRKLGIQVEDAGDVAYARLAEKEAGKLIRALLRKSAKDTTQEEES